MTNLLCYPTWKNTLTTAIVKESPHKDCDWDWPGNIIWINEHFPKKNKGIVHNEKQSSDDVRDDEDFDKFGWEGANNYGEI